MRKGSVRTERQRPTREPMTGERFFSAFLKNTKWRCELPTLGDAEKPNTEPQMDANERN